MIEKSKATRACTHLESSRGLVSAAERRAVQAEAAAPAGEAGRRKSPRRPPWPCVADEDDDVALVGRPSWLDREPKRVQASERIEMGSCSGCLHPYGCGRRLVAWVVVNNRAQTPQYPTAVHPIEAHHHGPRRRLSPSSAAAARLLSVARARAHQTRGATATNSGGARLESCRSACWGGEGAGKGVLGAPQRLAAPRSVPSEVSDWGRRSAGHVWNLGWSLQYPGRAASVRSRARKRRCGEVWAATVVAPMLDPTKSRRDGRGAYAALAPQH